MDITAEVQFIAERMNRDPKCKPGFLPEDVKGALWAVTQLTDYTQAEIEDLIEQARGGGEATESFTLGSAPAAPPVPVVQPLPVLDLPLRPGALLEPVIDPDEVVGAYPVPGGGSWPVTKWGEGPKAADMSKPPAPETTDSMAQAQRVGEAEAREAYQPIPPEELSEIEAEIEAARQKGTVYSDDRS